MDMPAVTFVAPILPGREEEWRRSVAQFREAENTPTVLRARAACVPDALSRYSKTESLESEAEPEPASGHDV